MEGKCDRVVRLINASGLYPDEIAIRASDAGGYFLVLLRHKQTKQIRQIEWREQA